MVDHVHWFMFRVVEVGNTYERIQSIYDGIMKHKPMGGTWFEPTSAGLIRSSLTAYDLVHAATRNLVSSMDLLAAANLSDPSDAAYFGNVEYPDELLWLLPSAKKVT